MKLRAFRPALLLCWCLGCQGLVDSRVEYVECFPSSDGEYIERFDGVEKPPGADRCWQIDNVSRPAYVQQDDGDLIIHPYSEVGARWTERSQAPFFFQTLTGDFLAITRAEAVSTLLGTDHCLGAQEGGGLVVRRREPLAWATLLVRPDLPADAPRELCRDDPPEPPAARVSVDSFGFDLGTSDTAFGVGEDGEAYIGVCRRDDRLFFFQQAIAPRSDVALMDFEQTFEALDVGLEPLDVGLTMTAEQGAGTLPEGHFNWLVLQDFAASPPSDGCTGALERFVYPEPE